MQISIINLIIDRADFPTKYVKMLLMWHYSDLSNRNRNTNKITNTNTKISLISMSLKLFTFLANKDEEKEKEKVEEKVHAVECFFRLK